MCIDKGLSIRSVIWYSNSTWEVTQFVKYCCTWLTSFFLSVSETNIHIRLYSYKLALKIWVYLVTQRLNEISIAKAHRICRWHYTFIYFFLVYLNAWWLLNIWEISLLRQVFCTLCLLHYSSSSSSFFSPPINLNYRYIILTCGISIL